LTDTVPPGLRRETERRLTALLRLPPTHRGRQAVTGMFPDQKRTINKTINSRSVARG
jgi:hypothetical protein